MANITASSAKRRSRASSNARPTTRRGVKPTRTPPLASKACHTFVGHSSRLRLTDNSLAVGSLRLRPADELRDGTDRHALGIVYKRFRPPAASTKVERQLEHRIPRIQVRRLRAHDLVMRAHRAGPASN